MNSLRRYVPCLVLGLTIAIAGVSFAQNANQTAGDKQASCCCMSAGCCGDSCSMMKKDALKNHVMSSDKDGCCGCCGDSCQMMKDAMKNHATSSDKHECCCGDSCAMKDSAKTSATNAKEGTSAPKHACCCCGDSCDMKDMKNMKEMKDKP